MWLLYTVLQNFSVSGYSFSVLKFIENGDVVFLKVNLIFRIKLGTIVARLLDRDSLVQILFLAPVNLDEKTALQMSRDERSEILHHHFSGWL